MKHYVYNIEHAEEIKDLSNFYCENVYKGTYLIAKNEYNERERNIGVGYIESMLKRSVKVAVQNPDKIITNFNAQKPLFK